MAKETSEHGRSLGCLPALVGMGLGFFVERAVTGVLVRSWSDCVGLPPDLTVEGLPDWSRVSLIGSGGLYLLAYCACLPLGFAAVGRLTRLRGRLWRAATGVLLASVLLAAVATVDLTENAAAKDGFFSAQRCPAGHPPWWPDWWPLHSDGVPASPG
jgi:hypothetical protein